MTRIAALALCTLICWAAPSPLVRAENPFGDEPARPAAAAKSRVDAEREAKVREALEQPTKVEFTETPLQDAVDFLKDYHGIEIQLDHGALEDAGIGSDTPVTRHMKGISLASTLRLLLDDMDCAFVVRNGGLLITSEDAARHMTELRVYDVNELVGTQTDPNELGEVLEAAVLSCGRSSGSAPCSAEAPAAEMRIVPYRNLLVIRASMHDHDEIAKLLGEIKAKLSAGQQAK
jgi:hypothetical protein